MNIQKEVKEKHQVNVNPDSIIGREISYQTAIEHEILQETREQTLMLRKILKEIKKGERNPPC